MLGQDSAWIGTPGAAGMGSALMLLRNKLAVSNLFPATGG